MERFECLGGDLHRKTLSALHVHSGFAVHRFVSGWLEPDNEFSQPTQLVSQQIYHLRKIRQGSTLIWVGLIYDGLLAEDFADESERGNGTMSDEFEFQLNHDGSLSLSEAVGQAIGAATSPNMWPETRVLISEGKYGTPDVYRTERIFDDVRANQIVNKLIEHINFVRAADTIPVAEGLSQLPDVDEGNGEPQGRYYGFVGVNPEGPWELVAGASDKKDVRKHLDNRIKRQPLQPYQESMLFKLIERKF